NIDRQEKGAALSIRRLTDDRIRRGGDNSHGKDADHHKIGGPRYLLALRVMDLTCWVQAPSSQIPGTLASKLTYQALGRLNATHAHKGGLPGSRSIAVGR